jgi:Ferritin-like domain
MKIPFTPILQRAIHPLSLPSNFFSAWLDRSSQWINRVRPFAKVMLFVLPLLLAASLIPTSAAYAQGAVLTPRQVTEYALTLEKLEADFYRRAVVAAQRGGLAGAPQIAKDAIVSYGQDEASHVEQLSAVLPSLGGDPNAVTIPANPNYTAILGRDPFANPTDFLLAGQYVEDLGVAAYKGQVQNLLAAGEAGKTVLAVALAIHSVEARHAAGVRFLRQSLLGAEVNPWISTNASSTEVIYNENRGGTAIPFNSDAFDGFATRDEVLALVGPILNVAQQSSTTSQPRQTTATPRPNRSTQTTPSSGRDSSTPVRALW